MMSSKKIIALIIIILLAIFISSCKEQGELEDIGIVIATALDYEDEEIVLTVEVIIPLDRVEASAESSSMILQERGDSVMEAIRNVTLNFDRKLFFSHNLIIIFGEDLARNGIVNYLDFFTRDSEPRESAYMLVAKEAKAYEIIGINSSLSGSGGEYLEDVIDNSLYTLKSRGLSVNEFFKYYYDRKTPLLSIVEIREVPDIDPISGQIGRRNILDVRGGAPFYLDKLVGYYSPEEMIGFNFLIDEVQEGIIVFEVPMKFAKKSNIISQIGENTTFEIVKGNTKNSIEIVEGKINLNIDVDVKGMVIEDNRGLDITNLVVEGGVEEACAEEIKEYITMTMEKAQELKTDSFGVNHLFYMKYPEEYRKIEDTWREEFSKIDYSIDVNVDIIKTGLTNTPTNTKRGEDY